MFDFGEMAGVNVEGLSRDTVFYYKKHLPKLTGTIVGRRDSGDLTHVWLIDASRRVDPNTEDTVTEKEIRAYSRMAWYSFAGNINDYIGCPGRWVPIECLLEKKTDIIVNDKTYRTNIYPEIGRKFYLNEIDYMVEIVEMSNDKETAWAEIVEKIND